ncbi:MAG: hypothetical protein ACFFB3_06895 [Candidatus Hodarchaeota archaeon]
MAKKNRLKESKADIDIEKRRFAILERLARGAITVRESWKLLDKLERSRPHIMDYASNFASPIPPQELEQLVMDKIAICNDREKYKLRNNLT